MSARDDLASLRRAFARGPANAPAPETCPAPETLWSAFHGGLPPAEMRQVVDHTAACPACAADWRLGLEMEREAEIEDEEEEPVAALAGRPRLVRLRAWIAVPLAAAAAFLISLMPWGGGLVQPGMESAMRGAERATVRSLVTEPALPRSQALLRCKSEPAALSYEILVGTLDEPNLSRSKGLAKCEYLVPKDVLAHLPRHTRLSWQVDAVLAGDRRVSSPTFHTFVD